MSSERDAISLAIEPSCEAGTSPWQTVTFPLSDAIDGTGECDVCVVGAGVSGLCVAYELARRGHRVVVVDARSLGRGQTARSTAHLVTALDERYFVLEERFGAHVTRAAARAHSGGIQWIEEVVQRHGIDCGFRRVPGTLVVPERRVADAEALLAREKEAALRAGVATDAESSGCWMRGCGSRALTFPEQAQIHPLAFLAGLAEAIRAAGGLVVAGHRVTALSREGTQLCVEVGAKRIEARHVVLATHGIPQALRSRLRSVQRVTSFAAAYLLGEDAPPMAWSLLWDGYWDDDEPYHYVRCERLTTAEGESRRVVIAGGEDAGPGEPVSIEAAQGRLDTWVREHFPCVGGVMARWCGTIVEPEGEFSLIGAVPGWPRVYIIAGDSGNGMTYAAIAARRLTCMIEQRATEPVEDVMFEPAR